MLLIQSSIAGCLGCFRLLTVRKNAAVDVAAQMSWDPAWCLLVDEIPPKGGFAGSCGDSICKFSWGATVLFPTATVPFYFRIKSAQGFLVLHDFANTYDWFSPVSQWCILTQPASERLWRPSVCWLLPNYASSWACPLLPDLSIPDAELKSPFEDLAGTSNLGCPTWFILHTPPRWELTMPLLKTHLWGFPGCSAVRNPPANAGVTGLILDPRKSQIPRSN